ncbi:hypothetical protein JWG39_08310 [Desulforhopalus vacuolatus]|uniref:hypothetical protein n=1 Tax=Desulforhopalus vacuolatus TaxID=40414 RepID=UPI001962D38A|nr:hypothetical protein [Desulforhopalus vacuolatus]MBM9519819.1 hypothetical protein [Desulforhopalus vacuolatus]
MRDLPMIRTYPLFLLFCILSCATRIFAGGIPGTSATFIDSEHGYSFTYPKQWQARLYRSGIVVSEVNSPNGHAGVQFRIIKYNITDKTFTANYINAIEDDLSARLLTQSQDKIHGRQCIELSFQAQRGGSQYYLYQLLCFIPEVSKLIIIQAGCKAAEKAAVAPIIHQISKSLVVLDPEKL